MYNFKTYNEEYIEVIKSIENKVHESLLDKKESSAAGNVLSDPVNEK